MDPNAESVTLNADTDSGSELVIPSVETHGPQRMKQPPVRYGYDEFADTRR